jgi:hypothetical protein
MSASATNQTQMRCATLTGSPKKKAAWRSLSNMKFGTRPGVVIRYQKPTSGRQQAFMPATATQIAGPLADGLSSCHICHAAFTCSCCA